MDLSIIVPCHNLEKWIQPLLDSLNSQEFSAEVEIYFVLDDCTDKTREVIEEHINKYKYQVNILECKVHSCGLARNVGLNLAKGNYIWFLDGDDWITSNDAISFLLKNVYHNQLPIIKFTYESNLFSEGWDMMVWQYIFSRELIGTIRFESKQPHEDVAFLAAIKRKLTQPILSLPIKFYHYNYQREGSNTYQYIRTGRIVP